MHSFEKVGFCEYLFSCSSSLLRRGPVDPDPLGQRVDLGRPVDEALRVKPVDLTQDVAPGLDHLFRQAVVNHMRGEKANAGMVVLLVVPGKERLTESTGFFDTAEALGEIGSILEGFELRLREGVVVAGMRPAVSLGDT